METQYVTLKSNLKIHTLIGGDTSNPPLVLIHGWPASGCLWRKIIPELSKHFYVLAPDLPGHGKSDKPEETAYDLAFFRGFILDFFDALHLKTASLAAHDLGGMAGLSFAVRHPERLDNFIIMDTSPYPEWPFMLNFSICLLKQNFLTPLFLTPFVFKQVLKTGFYNKNLITPEVMDLFRTPWTRSKQGENAFSNTIKIPAAQMVEPKEALQKIKVPTLILWGKNDFFFPFKIARQLHGDIKGSTLIGVDKAGHFSPEEQPDFIGQQIISFMKKT
ncbi:MAG: alpha/beta hydrolase [Proteobacteria bacterium]|nr:alpha/beta hydrolase [Pseudomonadota bacterium]MBU1585753.1 alpha/beta hydrolase [Pseudomonadota bacterium]MBU2627898.1 alpha/beta hydrolase [Pseudomonadota bacterium]